MVYAAAIFAVLAALFAVIAFKQRRAIASLIERRKEIVVEEHRMFSFLHGLGESLQTSKTQTQFYQ